MQRTRDLERGFGLGVVLHVDAHEGTELSRALDHAADVLAAEITVDVETHLRQLERDVGLQAATRERVERGDVAVGGRSRHLVAS